MINKILWHEDVILASIFLHVIILHVGITALGNIWLRISDKNVPSNLKGVMEAVRAVHEFWGVAGSAISPAIGCRTRQILVMIEEYLKSYWRVLSLGGELFLFNI